MTQKTTTRRIFTAAVLFGISTIAIAQQGTTAPPKPRQGTAARSTSAKPASAAGPAAQQPASAPASQSVATTITPELVEKFMQRMFGYNENVNFRVANIAPSAAAGLADVTVVVATPQGQQGLRLFITPDGQHAIMGDMMPFGADPFATARTALKQQAFGPQKGPNDAAMQMVEFADLQCPACKNAQTVMERLQTDFPNVRFVFQSFPLENIHPWANRAARYLDCIQRSNNDQAWTFIQTVFVHQSEVNEQNAKEKLDRYAGLAGADAAKIATCSETPEAIARVQRSVQLAHDLQVSATPTLFINGRPLQNLGANDYDNIKQVVQFEVTQAQQGK